MPLTYLLYQSQANDEITPEEIDRIYERSRINNAKAGLTGFLLYEQGVFLQYLEGPRRQLYECVARISGDTRHTDLQVISDGRPRQRYFPAWDMGTLDPAATSLAEFCELKDGVLHLNQTSTEDVLELIMHLAARSEENNYAAQ